MLWTKHFQTVLDSCQYQSEQKLQPHQTSIQSVPLIFEIPDHLHIPKGHDRYWKNLIPKDLSTNLESRILALESIPRSEVLVVKAILSTVLRLVFVFSSIIEEEYS